MMPPMPNLEKACLPNNPSDHMWAGDSMNKRVYVRKNNEKVKRWTREEAMLYEKFVEINYDTMQCSGLKRNTKIFMQMSRYIGNKSPSQCRSHH